MFSFNINDFPGFYKRDFNTPPIKPVAEKFNTIQVTRNYIQQDGGIPIKLTIDNDDANDIIYRTNPVDVNDTLIAPANGKTIIDNILIQGFIQITPNATTGKGTLSADLVPAQVLEKLGWIQSGLIG